MLFAVFLYPILYSWYIALPEMLYIIYAGYRSVAYDGPAVVYFIGFALYCCGFIADPEATMGVTAVLIAADIYFHRGMSIKNAPAVHVSERPDDPPDHFDQDGRHQSCPYCGSADNDGSHCYNCGGDF